MSKTFNSFDLIVICSLLWNLLKALVKVITVLIILVAPAFFIAEILTHA